jgi:hypothetical protein
MADVRNSHVELPSPEEYVEITYQLVHAHDGLVRLEKFVEANKVWQEYLNVMVRRARRQGYTWEDIGAVLGITRQAAHARFSPILNQDMPDEMYLWFDILKDKFLPVRREEM